MINDLWVLVAGTVMRPTPPTHFKKVLAAHELTGEACPRRVLYQRGVTLSALCKQQPITLIFQRFKKCRYFPGCHLTSLFPYGLYEFGPLKLRNFASEPIHSLVTERLLTSCDGMGAYALYPIA